MKTQAALAEAAPAVWAARFDEPADAQHALQSRQRTAERFAALLELALGRDPVLRKPVGLDSWAASSIAELLLLTRPGATESVKLAYREALKDADLFTVEATRRNLEVFRHLGLFEPNTSAALAEIATLTPAAEAAPPDHVVLFTGHMVDREGRKQPRFPRTAQAEDIARKLIEDALTKEDAQTPVALGIAGGACGADILFHEACEARRTAGKLMLALPPDAFQVASVQHGDADWVPRYVRLCERLPPVVLQDTETLPSWLAEKKDYDIWQRNNLWMMFTALTCHARNVTLMALYNPDLDPDGPGGTRHLLQEARKRSFKIVELDARALLA
jgi:hypothetical protein